MEKHEVNVSALRKAKCLKRETVISLFPPPNIRINDTSAFLQIRTGAFIAMKVINCFMAGECIETQGMQEDTLPLTPKSPYSKKRS